MVGSAKGDVAVVDDDWRLRESMSSLLESAGYSAQAFSSAEEFLQSGRVHAVICLITDVRMPGLNGLELQRRVRLERPQIPVIFVSGYCDDDARSRALEEGAVCFLHKPFDACELLPVLEAASVEVRRENTGE
jgi:FixJ family two-component response regulator